MSTPYHAAFHAHELTKRSSSDSLEKLGPSLLSATVDLNPHQLDAALFAFKSPLSRGAILADEVGLGKTIEAGLVLSQLWAERKRKILIIAPTILRKQWAQELWEKFHIRSTVIDSREYRSRLRDNESPLTPLDTVVICSYHFAWSKAAEIKRVPWDLVVIDEAHRLRNVYKSSNKIATAIHGAVHRSPMLLLTATPLQNTLLELFGLVSFIDTQVFGNQETFRARYMRGSMAERELDDLRARLRNICRRTLRRQVQEYVRFTRRIPITLDFTPSAQEQQLYEQVSEYLQRPVLNALPASQRQLITLVLRKLLASSTFAIAGTLRALVERLANDHPDVASVFDEDFESYDELREEWSDDAGDASSSANGRAGTFDAVRAELQDLRRYERLAESITENAKGMELLKALDRGFEKLQELGARRKAVIFTESRRTQAYLFDLLSNNGYHGRILTINGTNTDDRSGAIYRAWEERHREEEVVTGNKTVDLRAALVEHFRDHADILIATEAAAEGVNLQFCSLVVNYDLPWNPQRVEQRIGRCHRYGQSHDVVVINFVNRSNAADQRVFELLDQKFRLFDGVFGASDEVLGAVESGVDFERRIAEIYQTCRTGEEIERAFAELREALDVQIKSQMAETRAALIENFDEEVRERFRDIEKDKAFIGKLERALWSVTKYELDGVAEFHDAEYTFTLDRAPKGWQADVPEGYYQLVRAGVRLDDGRPYRLADDLAQEVLRRATGRSLAPALVEFDYTGSRESIGMIGLLDARVGCSGWLAIRQLTVTALDSEDHLLCAVTGVDGLDPDHHEDFCGKLFQIKGTVLCPSEPPDDVRNLLDRHLSERRLESLTASKRRNDLFFSEEIDKLERWSEDLKHGLETELKEIDNRIKNVRREARIAVDLEHKVTLHRSIKDLESERTRKRRMLYEEQDNIEREKADLLDGMAARLSPTEKFSELFVIQWRII